MRPAIFAALTCALIGASGCHLHGNGCGNGSGKGGCGHGGACQSGGCGSCGSGGHCLPGGNGLFGQKQGGCGTDQAWGHSGAGPDNCGHGENLAGWSQHDTTPNRTGVLSSHHHGNGHVLSHDNYQPPPPQSAGAVAYPYYTTRGPRDFLSNNPRGIGR